MAKKASTPHSSAAATITGCGAPTTYTSSTPAARAVTAPITTDDGYGLRPPGAYTAARRTGTSRSRTVCPCGSATSASPSTPASATARTLAIAVSRPSRTAPSSRASASSSSSRVTTIRWLPENCSSYSSSASSPRSATSSTIAVTWTTAIPATSPRIRAATAAAFSAVHSNRTDALQQRVDLTRPQLVRHGVGDQPRGRRRDLLAHDEPVLAQRRAGRGEVDDPLDEPGERRQLDRALDLDDLGLPARALEVVGGDLRIL